MVQHATLILSKEEAVTATSGAGLDFFFQFLLSPAIEAMRLHPFQLPPPKSSSSTPPAASVGLLQPSYLSIVQDGSHRSRTNELCAELSQPPR